MQKYVKMVARDACVVIALAGTVMFGYTNVENYKIASQALDCGMKKNYTEEALREVIGFRDPVYGVFFFVGRPGRELAYALHKPALPATKIYERFSY